MFHKYIPRILIAWLLFCSPLWATNEFQYGPEKSLSGQTLYVLLFSGAGETDAGEAWDGDSWEPLTTTWSNFDIGTSEVSTTGLFLGAIPAIGNKNIRWVIVQDANDDATPDSAADIVVAEGYGFWGGTRFVAWSDRLQAPDAPAGTAAAKSLSTLNRTGAQITANVDDMESILNSLASILVRRATIGVFIADGAIARVSTISTISSKNSGSRRALAILPPAAGAFGTKVTP